MLQRAALISAVILNTVPAWGAVRIDVAYDILTTEIRPVSRIFFLRGGTSFILNDDKRVTRVSDVGISTNAMGGYVTAINSNGYSAVVHYRISNGAITEYSQNQYVRQTTSIRTNGVDRCQASATLKPGANQRYFPTRDPSLLYSQMKVLNIRCSIRKI